MCTPELSIIVVSYNTRELLRECLTSATRPERDDTEILVVDNASSDGSADLVASEFPSIRLVASPDNLGFAAANNLALGLARGRLVLLLNPDARLTAGALDALIGGMAAEPTVGIVGPTLRFPDGAFQSSGFGFPTVTSELRQSRSVDWVFRRAGAPAPTAPAGRDPIDVDWVDGACLMIRRDVIEAIGPLDEQFFLYGEEVDWCFRAKRAGWRVVAVREATVVHHRGQSTGRIPLATIAYLTDTRLRFFRAHYGIIPALFVSVVFALGCLKQMAGERLAAGGDAAGAPRARLRAVCHWWKGLLQPWSPHRAGTAG